MLIATSAKGGTLRSIGSLSIGAPGGILTDVLPLNVRTRLDSVAISGPFVTSATCAVPMTVAAVPNAFENLIRRRSPPIVGRTTIRTVWFSTTGEAGRSGKGRGACTAVLHALTQCPLFGLCAVAVRPRTAAKIDRETVAGLIFGNSPPTYGR